MVGMPGIRGVLLDLDGTVLIGETLVPGVHEAMARLAEEGLRVIFLTNNSYYSRRMIVEKLTRMGLPVSRGDVFNSGYAAAVYVRDTLGPSRGVYVVGEAGLIEEMILEGHRPVTRAEEADSVVVGGTKDLTYTKLVEAHRAILRGALFVATNKDHVYMTEHGPYPGAGATVRYLEYSSRVEARLVGKPDRYLADLALRSHGLEPSRVVVVGDNEEVDMALAKRIGAPGILVLSGITKMPVNSEWFVARSLLEVPEKIRSLL
jgi:4-nitrophenyl phosphatase